MAESHATSDIRTDTNCIDFFTYKIVNYGNPLRIYRIITEKTENSNELLIKYKLIHTCNCTSEEWYGENPKFTADIE